MCAGRGSLRDKLLYCFDLFDVDGDGKVTKDEVIGRGIDEYMVVGP